MISRLGSFCAKVFFHTCPDPFVIAILLALLTAGLAVGFGRFPDAHSGAPAAGVPAGERSLRTLDAWRDGKDGIWKLLGFSMQMCLILVTGHALAATRPVRRAIQSLADKPSSPAQAAGLVAFCACATAIVNWGLGLIVGALMAREVGLATFRKGIRAHYPLLAAAGYMGLVVWHGGLSGSAPLSVTSLAEASKVLPAEAVRLLGPDGVALGKTLFSSLNFIVIGGLLIGVPLAFMALTPKDAHEIRCVDEFRDVARTLHRREPEVPDEPEHQNTIPDRLDQSPWIALLLALPLLLGVARFVWMKGVAGSDLPTLARIVAGFEGIGLNEINASMLAIGLLLHRSPRAYMEAAEDGARGCAAIMIQFPIYAGIMAIMSASGLVQQIAEVFIQFGSARTIPLFSFLSACVINFFIPSGGAQWAVQGPISLAAGSAAGIEPGRMVLTVAYGDQVTNMLQPFWALPLLSITGVRARDIIGYTAVIMMLAFVWIGLCLMVL